MQTADQREPSAFERAAEHVRTFPQTPGVYLMKDAAGVVIYIGKANNLRARAGSYFLKAAREEPLVKGPIEPSKASSLRAYSPTVLQSKASSLRAEAGDELDGTS